MSNILRKRQPELESRYSHRGFYQMCVSTGAVTVIAGASGVGRWDFTIEWDEGTPSA